jgi:hypothetical protein
MKITKKVRLSILATVDIYTHSVSGCRQKPEEKFTMKNIIFPYNTKAFKFPL